MPPDEQTTSLNQRRHSTDRHPARNIPTREQVKEKVRKQQPSRQYVVSNSGDHLEEGEDEILDEEWPSRLPTSARRYQGYTVSPEEVYQSGNTRYHVRYVDAPKRKSRQQLPPAREVYTDEVAAVSNHHNRSIHPLAWFGVFLILLIAGWIGLNAFTTWYQGVKDDWTYGQQRHFEIGAVVGHNDSPAHPSHFTAENDNGQIIVIELPGGDVSKARIYQIETVPGNVGNPPVKLSFQDMNADGKVDMLVQIGDTNAVIYVTLYNNGSQFVSKL